MHFIRILAKRGVLLDAFLEADDPYATPPIQATSFGSHPSTLFTLFCSNDSEFIEVLPV